MGKDPLFPRVAAKYRGTCVCGAWVWKGADVTWSVEHKKIISCISCERRQTAREAELKKKVPYAAN